MIEDGNNEEDIEEIIVSYLIGAPMKNEIGEQNSFINAIIHSLHYIPEIAKYFIEEEFSYEEQYNLLMEIQKLLDKYNKLTSILYCPKISVNLRHLNIQELRRELEYMFQKERLFQLFTTGDPADVFFVMMNAIHGYWNQKPSIKDVDESKCNPECPAHSTVFIDLVEQMECTRCAKKTELLKFPNSNFFYELKINPILSKISSMQYLTNFKGKLFEFSKEHLSMTEHECTQKYCKERSSPMKKNIILVNSSRYLWFNLTWTESNAKLAEICKILFTIPELCSNNEIFDIYEEDNKKKYELYGLICYTNGHYICFFISQIKTEVEKYWVLHNDMEVIKLSLWKDVITYCIMNAYRPVMIYYQELEKEIDKEFRCNLVDGDYFQMYNHSLKIDIGNSISYANELSPNEKVRPSKGLIISQDEILKQSLSNMKKEMEPKKKKRHSLSYDIEGEEEEKEETEANLATDGTKITSMREDTEEVFKPKRHEEDQRQEKYDEIDIDTLHNEPSRLMPYFKEGDWICKHERCNNINNSFTFQCMKCKTINMTLFQTMQQEKEREEMKKQASFISKNNQSIKQHMINKSQYTTTYQSTLFEPKLCINCNIPFKTKCKMCSTSLMQSFSQLKDTIREEEKICFLTTHTKDMRTISMTEQSGWVCFHCSHFNIVDCGYCKKCRKNKYVRQQN